MINCRKIIEDNGRPGDESIKGHVGLLLVNEQIESREDLDASAAVHGEELSTKPESAKKRGNRTGPSILSTSAFLNFDLARWLGRTIARRWRAPDSHKGWETMRSNTSSKKDVPVKVEMLVRTVLFMSHPR